MDGCGRRLPTRKSATRDHIIPAAFIALLPGERRRDFNNDWNIQPMCPGCNSARIGQVSAWPLFRCRCHHLQIGRDGGMYIHERTRGRQRRHLFVESAVGSGTTFLVGPRRLPGKGNQVGYSKNPRTRGGHLVIPVRRRLVPLFNWFELARIGRAEAGLPVRGVKGERLLFLPSGEVVSRSNHLCAKSFPVENGHRNLYYNPFQGPDS